MDRGIHEAVVCVCVGTSLQEEADAVEEPLPCSLGVQRRSGMKIPVRTSAVFYPRRVGAEG